jgi:hypothetical protein
MTDGIHDGGAKAAPEAWSISAYLPYQCHTDSFHGVTQTE